MTKYPVRFPRFRFRRAFSRGVLRFLLPRAARIELAGLENLPARGPLILAGNHSGMLEVLLMIAYSPKNLEIIGAGDIPMDPRYVLFTHMYKFIPVNRGNTDGAALRSAVGVLEQQGILGIFPEGGIWEMERSKAQKGVSWISGMAGVPVIPVGFGGLAGAWSRLIRFKQPHLTVTFGEAVPPPDLSDRKARKTILENHAEAVMDGIQEAIPLKFRRSFIHPEFEEFEFFVSNGSGNELGGALSEGEALARFFFRPVLLDTLRRNLKRRVAPLQELDRPHSAAELRTAVEDILGYLNENPNFFTYRFGNDLGSRVGTGLKELTNLLENEPEGKIRLSALRRYRYPGDSEESVDRIPEA